MGRPRKEPVVLKSGPGPEHCNYCGLVRPVGPLPYGWKVERRADASYVKGYWLPLRCPNCDEEYL